MNGIRNMTFYEFILFAPGDESPGYCHGCPAWAEASAGRPREGHQNRFKLALMTARRLCRNGGNGKNVMLNLFQHLINSMSYETLNQVQGDKKAIATQPPGEGRFLGGHFLNVRDKFSDFIV